MEAPAMAQLQPSQRYRMETGSAQELADFVAGK